MVAVERAVVQAFWLEEDHRVIVLDGGNQQALGVVGVGWHHGTQAADLGKHGLGALAVGLATVNPAAAGHADGHWRDKLAGRAVTQARRFRNNLVGRRVEVVGKLDFGHRAQAVGTHAHGGTDDATFRDRCVEHSRTAVLGLQAFGAAKHTAEVAHVLAKHHHVIVALEHHIHGRAQGLDHRHGAGTHGVLHLNFIVVVHLVITPIADVGGAGARACLCTRPQRWSPRWAFARPPTCRNARLLFVRR